MNCKLKSFGYICLLILGMNFLSAGEQKGVDDYDTPGLRIRRINSNVSAAVGACNSDAEFAALNRKVTTAKRRGLPPRCPPRIPTRSTLFLPPLRYHKVTPFLPCFAAECIADPKLLKLQDLLIALAMRGIEPNCEGTVARQG